MGQIVQIHGLIAQAVSLGLDGSVGEPPLVFMTCRLDLEQKRLVNLQGMKLGTIWAVGMRRVGCPLLMQIIHMQEGQLASMG
ncbi:MAG: hypothetical protein DHS20C20_00720 [Ardenticatenaceae bacterium]|nr:MAG: hypothetical protein DHS20C20_00720 [Ardenticatenaceae bacterium]